VALEKVDLVTPSGGGSTSKLVTGSFFQWPLDTSAEESPAKKVPVPISEWYGFKVKVETSGKENLIGPLELVEKLAALVPPPRFT
jgi:hypothetical protein